MITSNASHSTINNSMKLTTAMMYVIPSFPVFVLRQPQVPMPQDRTSIAALLN